MLVEDHLRSGKVHEALQQLQEQVRNRPADGRLRASIFQVLSVLGQWERAANQLKVLADLDGQALMFSRVYDRLIQAEIFRRDLFVGQGRPVIFGEPEPWMASLIRGNELAVQGDIPAARACLQEALDQAPGTPGIIDRQPCQWVADADLRFGACLEAVIDGRYFWVPFFRITELRLQPPKSLRDLVWAPAGFRWTNGGEAAGFVFVRYPETGSLADGELLLSRKTEWRDCGEGLSVGSGQRVLATDAQDYPILDLRAADFTAPEALANNTERPG